LVLHPQLTPEPQEDFAAGAGSVAVVEQPPVLHPPEVDVFVLQQPIQKILIAYRHPGRTGNGEK
jgi:hypothetical protein